MTRKNIQVMKMIFTPKVLRTLTLTAIRQATSSAPNISAQPASSAVFQVALGFFKYVHLMNISVVLVFMNALDNEHEREKAKEYIRLLVIHFNIGTYFNASLLTIADV